MIHLGEQVAYNEHYTKCHSGVIEERAEERQRVRLEQKQRQAERRRQVKLLKWLYREMVDTLRCVMHLYLEVYST